MTPSESPSAQDIVHSIAASSDFQRDGIAFAARSSGVYRSVDGAQSWHAADTTLQFATPIPALAVAVAPTFASDGLVLTGVPGGILRSVNRGDTWEIIALGAPPVTVTTFVFSPDFEKDGIVLAGTLEDGVFLSNDRGSRWAAWNFGLLDLHVLSLVISPTFSEDETIFAGTESGIARSTNGGRAWRDLGLDGSLPLTFAEPILSLALSPSYAADGIVFAGTETNGLICSCARGKSWKRIAENFIADPVNGIVIGKNELSQSTIAVLQSDALLVSHNGGSDWEQVEAPALDAELENDVTSWSAIAAPEGLGKGARLLVGLTNGNIRFVIL